MNFNNDNGDCESSDEDVGLRKKALYVDLPKDFNPNKVPQNGEEYLQHVMYEAKQCPNFVSVPLNIKKTRPAKFEIKMEEDYPKGALQIRPTMEWQEIQLRNFKNLLRFISLQPMSKVKVSHLNLNTLIDSEMPKLSILRKFSQEDKINALEHILSQMTHIHSGESISRQISIWIYSLLATLDIPLCPESCHLLRELARKCINIRSSLSEQASEDQYIPLNLFICLVSRYYGQLDLTDN